MFDGLDRDDLIDGLKEVMRRARDRGVTRASIRIIGGAALRLSYFRRAMTGDIDARIESGGDIDSIVKEIAAERGWPDNWLNQEASASGLIPTWGRQVEWQTLFDDDGMEIEVADVGSLLAMKLNAYNRRGARDENDVANLLRLAGIASAQDAEDHYAEYFPGDGLTDRTMGALIRLFERGLPESPESPPAPDFR